MRALITGARGTLGQALAAGLEGEGYEMSAALARQDCDLTDAASVQAAMAAHRPDVVFNAAAFTNVDGAEDAEDDAYRANAIGVETLARACGAHGARLFHYSTDFVFDGEQERPYDEFDPPSPLGAYARSKLAGERLAMAACPHVFVMRVGCLYGQGGRNFPSTILDRLKRGETIKADQERLASPTWVVPVVRASAALARTDHYGLYHGTAGGETTWAAYALHLAERLSLPEDRIQALPYGALNLKARRPRRAILDNRMLRLRGLDTLGTWQEQAEAFMQSQQ